PIADFDWNARSHLAFLELLRALASRAVVVYTSTRQIYGRPLYVPVDESHPVQPVDVNGISQHAAEQFHLLYARVHGLRACSLRLTNVYGPRLRLRGSRQGVLAVFLQRALEGQTIPVYGDGEHIRDFLYVSEAVGEAFNVSHSVAVTLREAAEAIVDAAGSGRVELVPWPRERAAIDIGDFLGDFAKARRILGWEPRVSFGDGLRATIAFYREHRHWYL